MSKKFENVKSIKFDVTFNGIGCVNFDGNQQKDSLINGKFIDYEIAKNKNTKYAKRYFDKDCFRYKVSSDCIRHEMYKDCMEFQNTTLSYLPHILYRAIAQPQYLERGYMFTNFHQMKKKSSYCITPAISETEHKKVHMELMSKSGYKGDKQIEDNDKGNTSLFFIENVGEETYHSEGSIDLTEMQFLSMDMLYDRLGVDVDGGANEKIFMDAMKENYGEDTKIGYYYIKSSVTQDEFAERGILLNKQSVDFMVKDIIKRIMKIQIWRKDARFQFKNIKVVVNFENSMTEEIKINNIQDIDDYIFLYYTKYNEADEEKIKANKNKIKELIENDKEDKKKSKGKKINSKGKTEVIENENNED